MIFWLFLILTVLSIVLLIINSEFWRKEWFFYVCVTFLTISITAVLTMLCFIIGCNYNINGQIASNQKRYEALVYQMENNIYENDNDVGKSELYNQVRNWNEKLANGKAMQNDFWFGIFYPDIYDEFNFIEFKG